METERLTVFPLTVRQLELLLSDLPAFEREAELTYDAEPIEGFMREYLADQIRIIKDDPNQWLYTALWLIVRKQDRVAVGSIAFKGKPDDQGIVEIGYGLSPQYEHNGYMTEAAGALTDWALTQDQVHSVIA